MLLLKFRHMQNVLFFWCLVFGFLESNHVIRVDLHVRVHLIRRICNCIRPSNKITLKRIYVRKYV